jgi:hypothetical protein
VDEEKLAERVAPFLEPGEHVQVVFPASDDWAPQSSDKRFYIVVTDRAIVVLDIKGLAGHPSAVYKRYGRNVYLGPLRGTGYIWGSFVLDNDKYYVHKRFWKEVDAADAALGQNADATRAAHGKKRSIPTLIAIWIAYIAIVVFIVFVLPSSLSHLVLVVLIAAPVLVAWLTRRRKAR